MKPYFSICIPVYNREKTILRTLKSIECQNFKYYEVLIIDDGSEDTTGKIVKQFIEERKLIDRYFYYYKFNGGKHTALNVGIAKAKGEFFIILDSDDWLKENCLDKLYHYCKQIENDSKFSGVMARVEDVSTGEMIGDKFDVKSPVSSYFDCHFILPQRMFLSDSFEANKTKILKKYRFPEDKDVHFVPEAWLFDQIGVEYNLLLTNDIFRVTEYLSDGMTKDPLFKQKNIKGFLLHYISRLENVLPRKNLPFVLRIKLYTLAWWRYWQCIKMAGANKYNLKKEISLFGYCIKYISPIIELIFKIKYPKYHK